MRRINTIVIHCSATPEGRPVSVATIRSWHLERGFRDVGYHFIIGLNGEIWPGRPIWEKGAHVRGHNANSIGICYVGGITSDGTPKDTRTQEQKAALDSLIKELIERYPEIDTICGHRDFPGVKKACPCFDAKAEYEYMFHLGQKLPRAKPEFAQEDPVDPVDETCQPAFKPDVIDDREVVIPAEVDKPVVKQFSLWERLVTIMGTGSLAALAPALQDWRVITAVCGGVVTVTALGIFFQGRLAKSIREIKDAIS